MMRRSAGGRATVGRFELGAGPAEVELLGEHTGSVHMAWTMCELAPGASLPRHLHTFEQAAYVLEGELELELDDRRHRLSGDDFALVPTGASHRWTNRSGAGARWLEVSVPQPRSAPAPPHTFVTDATGERATATPTGRFDPGDVAASRVQIEGFEGGGISAGVMTMLVDRAFGAHQLQLFVIEFEPGAEIGLHDHPFEEAYYVVAGEIEATLDGETHTLRPGDLAWTGVGCLHGFTNRTSERVRWIEAMAPQPPAAHAARFVSRWAGHAP
jgi:quercetin dioxygenase-like cupin family protein